MIRRRDPLDYFRELGIPEKFREPLRPILIPPPCICPKCCWKGSERELIAGEACPRCKLVLTGNAPARA
jgi:hypothetical protein